MAPTVVRQQSFAAGEFSDDLQQRNDLERYGAGASVLLNFLVTPFGSAENRAGTRLGARCRVGAASVLVGFNFSDDQSLIVEFCDLCVRFWARDQVFGTIAPLTAPEVYGGYNAGTTYAAGACVSILGGLGPGADGYYRSIQPGNIGHTPSSSPTWWVLVDTVSPIYELPSPYTLEQAAKLRWSQFGNVITLTGGAHLPYELTRISASPARFTLQEAGFGFRLGKPTNLAILRAPAGAVPVSTKSQPWTVAITAVDEEGNEGIPAITTGFNGHYLNAGYPYGYACLAPVGARVAKFRIYRGRPGSGQYGFVGESAPDFESENAKAFEDNLWTPAATYEHLVGPAAMRMFIDDGLPPDYSIRPPTGIHPFKTTLWQPFTRYEVGERVYANGNTYVCMKAGTSASSGGPAGQDPAISDGESTAWVFNTAYDAGDLVLSSGLGVNTPKAVYRCVDAGTDNGFGPSELTGEGVGMAQASAAEPLVSGGCSWEWVGGNAVVWAYVGAGQLQDRFPVCVAHQDERRIFAGTAESPSSVTFSALDQHAQFDERVPVSDADSFTSRLASRRYEEVRDLVAGRSLLCFTTSSEWAIDGGQPGQAISPLSYTARARSERGSSWLRAIKVGDEAALFVQRRGGIVRELVLDGQSGTYEANDLTLYSRHIFHGKDVVDWAWAEEPYSVVWVVLSDGSMASLTYLRQERVVAWARHQFTGLVKHICSVPDGVEDGIYLVVERGGEHYIERMEPRVFTDVRDSCFLEASVRYDGRLLNDVQSGGMQFTDLGGGQWGISYRAEAFALGEVIVLHPDQPDECRLVCVLEVGEGGTFEVLTGTFSTALQAEFGGAPPASTNFARTRRYIAVQTPHLGQELYAVCEGEVFGPLPAAVLNDINGQYDVDLGAWYMISTVGFRYSSDLELLDVPPGEGRNRVKSVMRALVDVKASRGLFVGEDEVHLEEWVQRRVEESYDPTMVRTEQVIVPIRSSWNRNGRVFLRQVYPLPLTVIGVMREVEFGGS